MSRHLLVTNDFPPKVGGIQSYLWELWRRIDPDRFVVLTAASHPDHAAFDAEQARAGIRIERVHGRVLYFPTPAVVRRIRRLADEIGAGLVLLDPALPLGEVGPNLGLPYGVILHGAEVAAPARLPGLRPRLAHVLRHAAVVVSAGGYPASEARRVVGDGLAPVVVVPPGVDCRRFVPLGPAERRAARRRLGLPEAAPLVASVSRLVPRKGMDVLVQAAGALRPSFPDLVVAIAGRGRDGPRLARLVERTGSPTVLLGPLPDADLPFLYGSADVFAMICRERWGGLEQEGFGIVFLEAAAAGTPQVAGRSGGAAEAVVDGETGYVAADPRDPGVVALALRRLLDDPAGRARLGTAGRRRAERSFDYDRLAPRLADALREMGG
jgi:phosphatidylinositol alpha-1,6-mannosyltransferase